MSIDLMSASGHKFGAPKGIGFLYIREGLKIEPLVYGGDQEYGLRGGTSNVPSIVGMGVAAEISVHRMEDADKAMKELKEYFIEKISSLVPRVRFNAESDAHIASNISMTIDRLPGERLLVYLDTKGVQVSMGSSCKARSHERSHVLRAIGLTDTQIDSTIRITMSEETTKDDIDYVIDCISRCVELSVC